MKVDSAGPSKAKKKDDEEKPAAKVEEGQTLKDVAKENKTTEEELLKLNPHIKDPNDLKAGQEIALPEKKKVKNGAPGTDGANAAEGADGVAGPDAAIEAQGPSNLDNAGVADVKSRYETTGESFQPQTAMPTGGPDAPLPEKNAAADAQLKEIRGRVGYGDGVAVAMRPTWAVVNKAVTESGEQVAKSGSIKEALTEATATA